MSLLPYLLGILERNRKHSWVPLGPLINLKAKKVQTHHTGLTMLTKVSHTSTLPYLRGILERNRKHSWVPLGPLINMKVNYYLYINKGQTQKRLCAHFLDERRNRNKHTMSLIKASDAVMVYE